MAPIKDNKNLNQTYFYNITRLVVYIIFSTFFVDGFSQENSTILFPNEMRSGRIENIRLGCGYNQELSKSEIIINQPSAKHVAEILGVLKYSGLPVNFEIYSANIKNAVAVILNEKRIILYDPELMNYVDKSSNNYWASISILAHEVGHHLAGHTLAKTLMFHQAELEADKFSGFVLYKMGATLSEATKALLLFGDNADTKSHPNKSLRIKAVKNGWMEAAQLRYDGAIPPPPEDIPKDYDTFYPEMLVDPDFIEIHQLKKTSPSLYIGIITEVDPEYNAGGIEIFVEQKLKTGDLEKEYNYSLIKTNSKIMFNIEWEPSGIMTNVQKSWFYPLLVPGRKIIFSCVQEGSGGDLFITYLKQIPTSK